MRLVSRLSLVLLTCCVMFAAPPVQAQVSLTTLGTAYTQNFDTLATSGTANPWTDNMTLPSWYAQFSATPANPTTYRADAGGSNTGAIYSWGTGASTERAFGAVASGTPGDIFYAIRLVNNTGSTITSLKVSFMGEQWRAGGCTPVGCTPAAQKVDLQYQVANAGVVTDANSPTTGWLDHDPLDFTSPSPGTATAAALDGNAAANRSALSSTINVTVNPGQEVWLRWRDINDANNDHGLSIDDFSVTPQGSGPPPMPMLNVGDVTQAEGDPPGTTTFTFAVTLTAPAGPGGVTFDIATVDGTATVADNDYVTNSLSGQSIPMGSTGPYNFSVTVNRDTGAEPNETFFVTVSNVVGATTPSMPGQGTINNDDVALVFIHDVQGNGAATPIPGATVSVEGVVTGNFQGADKLRGFFLQEEDTDANAEGDPATSEGIFIFCNTCPTPVTEGQRVRVTGSVSEFNNMTEITASTAGSVVVTDAGNNLAQVTPSPIDLPVVGDINAFYEAREGMLVTFVDTLTVSEYFEMARFGHIELFEGGRPRQFTEMSPPSMAGFVAHNDNLDRRRVILDDDDNTQNAPLLLPNGMQFVFHPRANGGFSVGTHGTDFFRGGDLVNGLTGVLHWSFPGVAPDTWRIRPTMATPVTFTVANPRPMTPPVVGGAIKAASMNLLNYFTTIDMTSSSSSGPCGPAGTQDCRGADSVAELNRQRERASIVICGLNADVLGFMELENTTATGAIDDLLGAVNARCGGTNPYVFVDTGGTLGTDVIRVALIYRSATLSPVGSPLVDLDPIHNRPPTAQTFDVIDPANPAFGERFTVIANHFKAKGCDAAATGANADAGDGQNCYNGQRTAQAIRLLTWINGTVLPAAGDPDVLLLGDFNAYAMEDPVTTLEVGGFTDLESAFLGPAAYSYLFDGQLGHLDYAFSSASLTPRVTGVDAWHINADEVPLFDYNDEVLDSPGEDSFEEKPDGSALVPPRVLFQPASPYRASDHDPVLVGLFEVAGVTIQKVEQPGSDPVTAGTNLTYTINVVNAGPETALNLMWTDMLPMGTTFVSLVTTPGWTCATPAVGSGGTVSCSTGSHSVGTSPFTLTVHVDPGVAAGTVLSNTANVTTSSADDPSDNSATETTTVATSVDLSVSKEDSPDPVMAMGGQGGVTYTISVSNAGPSNAATVTLSDILPAGTTYQGSFLLPGTWICVTPAVGTNGTISCTTPSLVPGTVVFTFFIGFGPSLPDGTVISNTATVTSATADPSPGNESATATTLVKDLESALSITNTDTPDPVLAGGNLTYTITATNSGVRTLTSVGINDFMPAGTTFVSITEPAGWTCPTTPPVGGTGAIGCSASAFAPGNSVFTLIVQVDPSAPGGTMLLNSAHLNASEGPVVVTRIATASTLVLSSAVSGTKTVAGSFTPGSTVTYTVVLSNAGPGTQQDNPGNEFSDVLPAGLTLASATATSGTAIATVATNTVTWNGSIAAEASVTITINATVNSGVAPGTTISNQGAFSYDADGNGTNEAPGVTDNPATAGPDATSLVVAPGAAGPANIPTLDEVGLALLVLLLAMGGALTLRKRRA